LYDFRGSNARSKDPNLTFPNSPDTKIGGKTKSKRYIKTYNCGFEGKPESDGEQARNRSN